MKKVSMMTTQHPRPRAFDIHAHILEKQTVAALNDATPEAQVSLVDTGPEFSDLTVRGVTYKKFPRGGWDVDRRLADMKRYGYDRQLLAATPQTFLHDIAPEAGRIASQVQNDAILARCKAMPDRFLGLATLPMQSPDMAAAELARAMDNGMSGAMIGSHTNGTNLDDPALEPLWAEAEKRSAFMMIHPVKVAGIERQKSYYLQNFIGNPLDTTIAAACLVFGGVLERFPNLKIVLSHGGGFTPYQAARWIHGWAERDEAKVRLKGEPGPSIDKLIYDAILHDGAPLLFLIDWAGSKRVLLGSDYPFDMGQYDQIEVINSLRLTDAARRDVLAVAAEALVPGA
jgi:aminocarboxymuconate-semialdehyde decarboxylase